MKIMFDTIIGKFRLSDNGVQTEEECADIVHALNCANVVSERLANSALVFLNGATDAALQKLMESKSMRVW